MALCIPRIQSAPELKACLIDAIYNPSASAWSAAAAEALQTIRLSDDEVNSILGRWKDISATLQALILRAIENSLDALSGSCRQGLKKVFLLMIVARPDSSGLATLQRMLAKLEHMEKTPGG